MGWPALTFPDAEVERAYRDAVADSWVRPYRVVTAAAVLLGFGSWFADPALMVTPGNLAVTHALKLATMLPLGITMLALGYLPMAWFQRLLQPVLAVSFATPLLFNY